MNSVQFIGRLTKDPETRVTADQKSIAKFSLAVDRRFKKGEADFFNFTTFGKTAEFAEKYLKKGMKIAVVGRAQQETWQKDGKNFSTVTFIADEIEFAESKGSGEMEVKAPEGGFKPIGGMSDEDLPFAF